jgi:hypothetical protein
MVIGFDSTTSDGNRPISEYGLGEIPIQSCGQSVSARRGKQYTGIGLVDDHCAYDDARKARNHPFQHAVRFMTI